MGDDDSVKGSDKNLITNKQKDSLSVSQGTERQRKLVRTDCLFYFGRRVNAYKKGGSYETRSIEF